MKILIVITGMGMGGAENQVCQLADSFASRGHDVRIVILNGDIVISPTNKSVKLINLEMPKNFLGLISGIFRLRKIIDTFMPDVIHGHMYHANILSRLAAIGSKCNGTVISTAHSKNEGGFLRMLVYRLTNKLCNLSTNVSLEALNEFFRLKAFNKNSSKVVYNGIDLSKFRYDSQNRENIRRSLDLVEDDVLLLAVGRLTPAKDYPNLLAAMTLLPKNFKLAIIGDGDLRNDIESLINKNNLNERVRLMGAINNVAPYYSACDIFVLSSMWEGFGLVIAEAMSCERIVVGTNAGGVREVVGSEDFIVPISSSAHLAEKILYLNDLSENEKRDIMIRNRNHIESNFSLNKIVSQWEIHYSTKRTVK